MLSIFKFCPANCEPNLNKMIFYENNSKNDEEEMWNETTITNSKAISMFRKNRTADSQLDPNDFEVNSESTYKFVTVSSFLNCDHQKWLNCNLQTVGRINVHQGYSKLYPLHKQSDCILLYIHSEALHLLTNSHTYAHVFGFPVFYSTNERTIPIAPCEVPVKPLILLHVVNLINLESLVNAKRLEYNLCRINYLSYLIKR